MARLACHLNDIHRGTAFFCLPACFIYGCQASQPGFCVHLCRLLLYSILENMTIGFQPFCVRILETLIFEYLLTCVIWCMPKADSDIRKTDTRKFDNRVSTLLCSHTRNIDNRVSNDTRKPDTRKTDTRKTDTRETDTRKTDTRKPPKPTYPNIHSPKH